MALLIDKAAERPTNASPIVAWHVQARDDFGAVHALIFNQETEPTDQQIIDAMPKRHRLEASKRESLRAELLDDYEEWRRWRETHAEAVERNLAPAIQSGLAAQVETAWTAYLQTVNRWRQAS